MSLPSGSPDPLLSFGARIGAYRNVAWLLLACGAGLAWLVGFGLRSPYLGLSVAVLLVSACMLGASVILFRRASTPMYRWVSAEYIYRFDAADLRRQTQTIKIRIRANRDNVNLFHNTYRWTGVGTSTVRVANGSQRICETREKISGRRHYYVHLDQPLSKGEETLIHLEQELFDASGEFEPILAKIVSSPLAKLTLKVVFPSDQAPRAIVARRSRPSRKRAESWRTIGAGGHDVDWSDNGATTEACYSPDSPKVGIRYDLRWDNWGKYPSSQDGR
ncbi:hypothetical protein AMIS_59660 [Actinoplanes missouriensis 431]|uniref:Uncharacterized protein n=1 Tax=Actinoplanes missouriensis (strain ATCC 14538 / DSM 43046 / CBS 188.64 / JCM 3121 / NBRC 102363 / NCIMB 12654 / NRRL B-3342 / UNCC 431) TaxID=512565 RepID=I0HDU9_ACTM4|nr:hypothetical protein [Actinoplanes missouriensis]BAL91186.1 hypothetical protein AMIS_59660 [Actinoplanes missouriensis 431]